tara:strand:+ start:839 stop:1084 length:246 start_codon:yes stop_codon:yes gene_type:complete
MPNENIAKYKEIFIKSLSMNASKFNEDIQYNEIDEWDSIGHMTLISDLEEGFGITIETDDIVDFSSFKKGKEILNKYKIKL